MGERTHRPTRAYLDTPEGQLHLRTAGDGPPLILLHQAPGSSAMWEALIPFLARRGRRAIAIDLPGYGMSDKPPAAPDLSYYARRIVDAADRLGLARFDLFGHHTGASVALTVATEHAGRVRAVVAYGLPNVGEPLRSKLANEPPPVYDEAATDVVEWWHGFWDACPSLGPIVTPRCIAEMLLAGEYRHYGHNAVGRADHEALIDALSVPMLALAGRREMNRRETEAAAARSRWITFQELGDAGIFAGDENPEALADSIVDFLETTVSA